MAVRFAVHGSMGLYQEPYTGGVGDTLIFIGRDCGDVKHGERQAHHPQHVSSSLTEVNMQ